MKNLILVDTSDQIIGYGEKLEVHQKALLHRAFSIFVMNEKGELMLQRRSLSKYHSGGLWANTCCSHPLKGEDMQSTIHDRLQYEMGFDCTLEFMFKFIYRAELDHGLVENEYDHVYLGFSNNEPKPKPDEVCDWKWVDMKTLEADLSTHPKKYAYWLRRAFSQFYQAYQENMSLHYS